MGKKSSLSTEKRTQIVTLSNLNFSVHAIAKKVKVSKTAAHNAIMKYQNEGTFNDRKRPGWPRVSSCRDDHVMHKVVIRSPMSSSNKIQDKGMRNSSQRQNESVQVVNGFWPQILQVSPKTTLDSSDEEKTSWFRQDTCQLGHRNVKNVLFSDESTVQQFSVRRYRVWRLVGTRYGKKYTTRTAKHPLVKWYGERCPSGGQLDVFLPPGTAMNGEKYVNLLKSKVELHMRVHNCDIFIHDGAPCHRSKVVKNFLQKKTYPKVGVARKRSGVESYRKLVELYEEGSLGKTSLKPWCTSNSN